MKNLKFFRLFVLLLVFSVFWGCKKLPTTPDLPELQKPTIKYFKAEPSQIKVGEISTLSWEVSNATSVTIDNGIGSVSASGSKQVSPESNTIYKLTAKNSAGTVTQSLVVTVTVNPEFPVIESFIATPPEINPGEFSTLSWKATSDTPATASIDQGIGQVTLEGSMSVSPTQTTVYTLTASNDEGSVSQSVEVKVVISPPEIVYLTAFPDRIKKDEESSTLSWKVTSAASATASIDQGIGQVTLEGSMSVSPTQTTVYTLTAASQGGSVSQSVEVNAFSPPIITKAPIVSVWGPGAIKCDTTIANTNTDSIFNVQMEIVLKDENGQELARAWTRWFNEQGPVDTTLEEMPPGEVKWRTAWVDEDGYILENHDPDQTVVNIIWSPRQ